MSGIDRVVEGFRLAFKEELDLPDSLRLDFWAKTARTRSLLEMFAARRESLLERHLVGLKASADEGKIAADLAEDLTLVEDLIQAMTYGVHAWASLERDQDAAGKRAMKLVRLFANLLARE